MTDEERLTAIVYGDTFALYNEREFDEFVAPLYARLRANKIDTSVFRGKRCLDAGCGGGRGSILMAQCGAAEVVGVDLSATNVETSRTRAAEKGFTNVSFRQASLLDLPFDDEGFDVVWCNGVLHHTSDPDRTLTEITRVLKSNGHLWLYLYGSGGTYWYVVDWIRATLAGVDVHNCICQLRLMGTPVRRIAEWIDDWFAAFLRRYTLDDVSARLAELGYDDTTPLARGVDYDTSERRNNATPREREHMGQGDVRHFARKVRAPSGHSRRLPDPPDGKGSPYSDASAVTQFSEALAAISEELASIEARAGHEISAMKIIVCASVHAKVRGLLESNAAFDEQSFADHLAGVAALLRHFGQR